MEDNNKDISQLEKINAQLFQIKILLIILIALCLLGFYGISRSMWDDIAGIITAIFEVLLIVGLLAIIISFLAWISARFSMHKMNSKIDKELQDIIDQFQSEEDTPARKLL
jgi:hypothetical protein